MRAPIHRLLPVAVLLVWMAPSAGALGVALHLALDHHGPHEHPGHQTSHGAGHEREFPDRELSDRKMLDLARAATHGHHHDLEDAAHHDHDATLGGPGLLLRRGLSQVAAIPPHPSAAVVAAERSHLHPPLRRGPPAPLFTAHVSLLL